MSINLIEMHSTERERERDAHVYVLRYANVNNKYGAHLALHNVI